MGKEATLYMVHNTELYSGLYRPTNEAVKEIKQVAKYIVHHTIIYSPSLQY